MIVLVLISLIFIILIYAYYKEQNKFKGIEKIPGPLSLPLIGNSFSFGFNLQDYFKNIYKFHELYGPIVRIWPIWLRPRVIINDADAIGTLLNSRKYIDKTREYTYIEPWLGTGLLTSTGLKWHQRRKLITPAFHFKILEQFIDIFAEQSEVLIEKLLATYKEDDNITIDIYPVVKLCALDIICRSAMDTSINAQSGVEIPYVKAVKEILKLQNGRQFSMWKNFGYLYKFSTDSINFHKAITIAHNFTSSIITQRKRQLEQDKETMNMSLTVDDSSLRKKPKLAFLDLLIEKSGNGLILSNEDIREEVDTFMFEGHDTITSAISFTLFEISQHPQVQDKILNEIKSILPNNLTESIKYSHLQELNYLGLVIKEALRLYPPVPFYERELLENVLLGKYEIPRHTGIIINAFSIHRQEKYFPNPNNFDPDRFSIDNSAKNNPFCYIPFSGGPRNCIGQRFAMLEMKMVIAKILWKFELLPDDQKQKPVLYSDGILKSMTGLQLKIKKRLIN